MNLKKVIYKLVLFSGCIDAFPLFKKREESSTVVTEGVDSTIKGPVSDFEEWLSAEEIFAFNGILKNIGGPGSFTEEDDVAVGAVIAAPSKVAPDYFFQWTRDAAITIQSLIEQLDDSGFDDSRNLTGVIESYILNSYVLQRIDNLSGEFESLDGLGEPKFMANSTVFSGDWGRPQRDGPALRVITISKYLDLLSKYGKELVTPLLNESFIYNDILKPDLQYTVKNWAETGFDLWEEVNSLHLFTSLTQLRSLKMGSESAMKFDDQSFSSTLNNSFESLKSFIVNDSGYKNDSFSYLIETPSLLQSGNRIGLDAGSMLGILLSHDINKDSDNSDIPFPIDDVSVLNTLVAMVDDMRLRYTINQDRSGLGIGLGRYPEDVYNGYETSEGNPWFICTATASEIIYKFVYHLFDQRKPLEISIDQSSIFESITSLKLTTDMTILPFGSAAFNSTTTALLIYADTFLDVIKSHTDDEGHLSEQFNRYTGYMQGANDLTWSYGSFWSALRWRTKALEINN